MEEEKLHSYCKKCNLQVELVEEGKYITSFPLSDNTPPEDTPIDVDIYLLLQCPKCHSPFLYLRQYNEMPAEWCNEISEPKRLYPQSSEIPLDLVPASIKKAFEDALQAHEVGLYSPAALMCRKTIEAICYEKGAKKGNLQKKLLSLKDNGIIDNNIYEWADGLRLIGNEAAHDLLPNISKEDSQDTINFTESVILTVFVLSNKFEEFKARRDKKQ